MTMFLEEESAKFTEEELNAHLVWIFRWKL
jgi:hypothetical protein